MASAWFAFHKFTNFFYCILFGNLGTCRALARPWLEPSNRSWRGTSAANGVIPSRNSPQVCACALWVPRLALFLSRRWLTPCALQEFRMKVEQNFYVRTFVKVRPKGFTCFTNSTPSVTCRFCVDLLCCCVHLLRCLCRCHWTLWRVLWHLDMYHLATEERVFHGPSSEFCFRLFCIYTGLLSREVCAWLYLTAHIFKFIWLSTYFTCSRFNVDYIFCPQFHAN